MDKLKEIKLQEFIISKIDEAQHSYIVDSGIMPFIRSVPVLGDMLSTTAEKAIKDFQDKKQKQLVDYILEEKELITSEKVNDVEFLINFSKTIESVKRLATNDKIIYFANLIKNGYLRETRIDNDDFEEFSNIINELSFREITYLIYIKNHKNNNDFYNWQNLKNDFSKEFKIDIRKVEPIFRRLMRTGFIEEMLETDSGEVEDNNIDALTINNDGFILTESFDYFYNLILSK